MPSAGFRYTRGAPVDYTSSPGVTRSFSTTLEEILRVLDPRPGHILFGLSVVIAHGRTVLLADTAVHELPSAQELAGSDVNLLINFLPTAIYNPEFCLKSTIAAAANARGNSQTPSGRE